MEAFDANTIINLSLLSLLVVTAIAVSVIRNLLTATIILGIYSFLMAAMYLVLGAPDVAITEAAIGAGISTILFLAVLLLVGENEKASKHPILPLVVVFITGAMLIYAALDMPSFGDPDAIANTHLIPHYLEESGKEIGIPNVVTSILASYRGFDTLGEVFVIFTAGVSVLMLIGGKRIAKSK